MAEHPPRCRYPWCEATTHTPTDLAAAHHHGHTTTFPGIDGTTIGVTIVHAERPGWFPHIAVTRSAGTAVRALVAVAVQGELFDLSGVIA
jgi:hypothetical protein